MIMSSSMSMNNNVFNRAKVEAKSKAGNHPYQVETSEESKRDRAATTIGRLWG